MRNLHIKKHIELISCALAFVIVLGTCGPAYAGGILQPAPVKKYVTGEVIIKYKAGTSEADKKKVNSENALSEKAYLQQDTELAGITSGQSVQQAVARAMKDRRVEAVQPNYIYDLSTDDTYFSLQWGLNNTGQNINGSTGISGIDIDAPEAWATSNGMGDANLVVAVIDTGVDISHEDLAGSIWVNKGEIPGDGIDNDGNGYVDDVNGWNFYSNSNSLYSATDGDYHGTHIAGIIAARSNNSTGISGIASNVKIMPVKFAGKNGGTTADAIKALSYAKKMGAALANCSWGGSSYDGLLMDAINDFGKPVIAASGNDGADNDVLPVYPASFDCSNIISVASANNRGMLSAFSNYGAGTVDVCAPGESIYSCYPGNSYAYLSGTSMAAPFVSGIAALVLSKNPGLTAAQVRNILIDSSTKLAPLEGSTVSGGLVNAFSAVGLAGAEQTAPTGLKGIAPTTWGGSDGMITGVSTLMEYRSSGSESYTAVTGTTITGLAAGKYYVRYAARTGVSAGADAEVTLESPVSVLAGSNRFETAAEISKASYSSASTVILATGWNFPDALAAGPLAVQENAPVLLTERDSVPQVTLDEIERLKASKVIVLGSEGVVGPDVDYTLEKMGITVERVSGSNRFGTAVEVAKKLASASGSAGRAVLAYGWNYPDALAVGSYAAREGMPILLTDSSSLTAETKAALMDLGITDVLIVGSTQVISKAVESELTGMGISYSRCSGSNRFGTAADIAGEMFPNSRKAVVSYGWNFPDALAAVPLAARMDAPILLVDSNSVPEEVQERITVSGITSFVVTGGDPPIGIEVKNELIFLAK